MTTDTGLRAMVETGMRQPVADVHHPQQCTIPGLTPDPEPLTYATLGYSRGLITYDPKFGDFVMRECEGCGAKHRFEPRVGFKRMERCQRCARMTSWRILV